MFTHCLECLCTDIFIDADGGLHLGLFVTVYMFHDLLLLSNTSHPKYKHDFLCTHLLIHLSNLLFHSKTVQ